MNKLLLLLALYFFCVGVYILVAPIQFYLNTPGVAAMGPFNLHFIRDVALAFLASSAALCWGAFYGNKSTAIAGAAWPFLHALFHIQIWAMRSFTVDQVTVADFIAVIIPGCLGLFLASQIRGETA